MTRYPHLRPFIELAAAGAMYNELRRLAVLLNALPVVDAPKDPEDNFSLAMVQAGDADVLVTGDKHSLYRWPNFPSILVHIRMQLCNCLRCIAH